MDLLNKARETHAAYNADRNGLEKPYIEWLNHVSAQVSRLNWELEQSGSRKRFVVESEDITPDEQGAAPTYHVIIFNGSIDKNTNEIVKDGDPIFDGTFYGENQNFQNNLGPTVPIKETADVQEMNEKIEAAIVNKLHPNELKALAYRMREEETAAEAAKFSINDDPQLTKA